MHVASRRATGDLKLCMPDRLNRMPVLDNFYALCCGGIRGAGYWCSGGDSVSVGGIIFC